MWDPRRGAKIFAEVNLYRNNNDKKVKGVLQRQEEERSYLCVLVFLIF